MQPTGTRERVRRLLELGQTVAEIAEQLGVSRPTVCYHKRKLGYQMNERFASRYDWVAVQAYYDLGHTMRECMSEFGFSAWAWAYAVKRGAIVTRPGQMPLEDLLRRSSSVQGPYQASPSSSGVEGRRM